MIRLNFRRRPNAAKRLASDQWQAELFMDFCGRLTHTLIASIGSIYGKKSQAPTYHRRVKPVLCPQGNDREGEAGGFFQAEAQYQMTGKVTDGRLVHIDQNTKIKLKPTPGNETIYEAGQEVRTSMPGGGYFAFISQAHITKYFTVVRRSLRYSGPQILVAARGDRP